MEFKEGRTTVLEYLRSKEFIDELIANDYFITDLINKINDKVELNDGRLVASELCAVLDEEELSKMIHENGLESIWKGIGTDEEESSI